MMANVDHEPIVGVIDNAHNPSRQLIVGDFISSSGCIYRITAAIAITRICL